mmetsp:Transcript_13715/g.27126  ORF Transcript_13715/g.27126 Transcript_13715/m.27126 type:complete len:312 (-) Transcript_13715:108-1043(-)
MYFLSAFVPFFNYMGDDPAASTVLDFVFCLHTCVLYRRSLGTNHQPWLQTFLGCIVGTFGGTVLTSFALGIPISFLSRQHTAWAFALAWWLVFCSPGDFTFWVVSGFRPIHFVLEMINCIAGGHAISSWGADKVLSSTHMPGGSGPLTILCGMLSGCGGGILCLWFGITGATEEWSFRTPPTLKKAGLGVKQALFSSILYYLMRNPHATLPWKQDQIPKSEASVVIWFLWTAVLIATEFKIEDPFAPLSNLIGLVLMVPADVPKSTAHAFKKKAPKAKVEDEEYEDTSRGSGRGGGSRRRSTSTTRKRRAS